MPVPVVVAEVKQSTLFLPKFIVRSRFFGGEPKNCQNNFWGACACGGGGEVEYS